MAIGAPAALMLAGGAFQATSSVMAGNQQARAIQKQSEFNAQVYEQQAEMVKEKRKIQDVQFLRQAAQARGSIVATTAGKGFNLGGSPLAILADNESQMQFDKAIEDYNLNVEQNYAMSGASYMRQTGKSQAKISRAAGYSNAFKTMLTTGMYAYPYISNPLATVKTAPGM